MAELTPNATPPPDCVFGTTKAGLKKGKSESADGSADISPYAHDAATKNSGETATTTQSLKKKSNAG
ncbi:MAG: hypothetical protein ACQCN3_14375 [Candidatus Bathyarchaeia archaeon]|jgi:hypothetical protein